MEFDSQLEGKGLQAIITMLREVLSNLMTGCRQLRILYSRFK